MVLLAIDIFIRLMIVEDEGKRPILGDTRRITYIETDAKAFDERKVDAEISDSPRDTFVSPSDPDPTARTALLESRNLEQSSQKTLWQRFPVLRLITRGRMVTALLVAALDVIIFSALETVRIGSSPFRYGRVYILFDKN